MRAVCRSLLVSPECRPQYRYLIWAKPARVGGGWRQGSVPGAKLGRVPGRTLYTWAFPGPGFGPILMVAGFMSLGSMLERLFGKEADQPPARNHRRSVPRRAVRFDGVLCTPVSECRVRGVNLHEGGALVIATKPLPAESVVFVHMKSLKMMGFAYVRHCTRKGWLRHAVGLKFRGPLMREGIGTWRFEHIKGNLSDLWPREEKTVEHGGEAVSVSKPENG